MGKLQMSANDNWLTLIANKKILRKDIQVIS